MSLISVLFWLLVIVWSTFTALSQEADPPLPETNGYWQFEVIAQTIDPDCAPNPLGLKAYGYVRLDEETQEIRFFQDTGGNFASQTAYVIQEPGLYVYQYENALFSYELQVVTPHEMTLKTTSNGTTCAGEETAHLTHIGLSYTPERMVSLGVWEIRYIEKSGGECAQTDLADAATGLVMNDDPLLPYNTLKVVNGIVWQTGIPLVQTDEAGTYTIVRESRTTPSTRVTVHAPDHFTGSHFFADVDCAAAFEARLFTASILDRVGDFAPVDSAIIPLSGQWTRTLVSATALDDNPCPLSGAFFEAGSQQVYDVAVSADGSRITLVEESGQSEAVRAANGYYVFYQPMVMHATAPDRMLMIAESLVETSSVCGYVIEYEWTLNP